MAFELITFNSSFMQKQAANEIVECNKITILYGLMLTQAQAIELVETRSYALKANGRIEFGSGIIDKIIKEFCDSPYIYMENYAETIQELIEVFYYYKNETLDLIGDDELIKYMKAAFDGACQGSLQLLSERELSNMARNLRFGYPYDYVEDSVSEEDEDEEYQKK